MLRPLKALAANAAPAWRPIGIRFVEEHLLKLKAARDEVRLIANTRKLVAKTTETQSVDRAIVYLKIINAPQHGFGCLYKLVGDGHSI